MLQILALIGFLIGTNVYGHTDWFKRGLHIGPRSHTFDNDQVSATINNTLAESGFDADEAGSLRAGYHIAVDQFDDNKDESMKLLSDVLLKVLNAPDVDKIDGSLNNLGDKFDGLVPKDVDTTAGSKDGVKPGHIIVAASAKSVNDLAPRDTMHVSFAEAMATWMDSVESLTAGIGPLPERLKNKPKDDGSKPEKREEATDHAGSEPVKLEERPAQNGSPVEHPATEPHTLNPFLEKFNTTGHRSATPEDARRIFFAIQNAQSLTDSERAKLKFLAKLNAMGLLKEPMGKRALTLEEVFERIQSIKHKVNTDLDTTPTSTVDAPALNREPIPILEAQGSHSKRSVPKFPGCDCEATIEAVKDPKPEGGMTYKWFQNWEHKAVNTFCVRPCVDNAIDHFTKTVFEYQAFEERMNKEYPGCLDCQLNQPSVEKREEPTDLPAPAEAKVSIAKKGSPMSAHTFTYRDWYEKTQKTGQYCTCSLQKPSMWTWVMALYQKSQRCRTFCSQSVKPFLEKVIPAELKQPATAFSAPEKLAEESSPSPSFDLMSVSQVPQDDTRPEFVKTEPEVVDES